MKTFKQILKEATNNPKSSYDQLVQHYRDFWGEPGASKNSRERWSGVGMSIASEADPSEHPSFKDLPHTRIADFQQKHPDHQNLTKPQQKMLEKLRLESENRLRELSEDLGYHHAFVEAETGTAQIEALKAGRLN